MFSANLLGTCQSCRNPLGIPSSNRKPDTLYLCYCQEFDVSVVPCNTFTSFILYFKRRSPVRTKLVSEIIFFPADSMRVFPASLAEQVSQGTGVCALATSALLEG